MYNEARVDRNNVSTVMGSCVVMIPTLRIARTPTIPLINTIRCRIDTKNLSCTNSNVVCSYNCYQLTALSEYRLNSVTRRVRRNQIMTRRYAII